MKTNKIYKYLTDSEVNFHAESSKYKTQNGLAKYLQKLNDDNKEKAEKPDVKKLVIEVEWKESSMYGLNPTATGSYLLTNGEYGETQDAKAGGCGYDKLSTVVASICNQALSGMLYRARNKKNAPYGITIEKAWFPRFDGGVGISCYYKIAEFLGGKMEIVAQGKRYDKIVFTFRTRRTKKAL